MDKEQAAEEVEKDAAATGLVVEPALDEADEDETEYELSWSERLGGLALRRRRLFFWLTLGLATVLRLGRLGERSVWYDESFSLTLASKDLPTLLTGTANQHHPPLGYLVLDVWLRVFGNSPYVGRLLAAGFGIAFVAVVYGLAKEMFGSRTALVAMGFAAVSPFQILYSQEVRHYSLEALLGTGLVWSFYRAWRRNTSRAWAIFGLLIILAIYNLYYSLLGVAALDFFCLGLLVDERRRSGSWPTRRLTGWLAANVAAGLAYAPWSLVLLNEAGQVKKAYWIETPNPLEVFRLTNVLLLNATNLTVGPLLTLAGLLLGPIITIFLLNALRFRLRRGELGLQRRSFEIALLLAYWWLPVGLALVISYVFAPIYLERSLIGFAAPVYILLGRAIQTARRPALWLLLLGPTIIVLLGSLYSYYFSREYTTHYENEQAVAHIGAAYQRGDLTLHSNKLSYQPFDYLHAPGPQFLAPEEPNNLHDDTTPDSLKAVGMAFTPVSQVLDTAPANGRIWFVRTDPQPGQHAAYLDDMEQQLAARQYRVLERWEYWGGVLILYGK